MTAREIYESVLAEVNKYNAPAFSLEEFNYNLNKAILAFTNEKYSYYPVNQQLSDDLRVLVKHAKFNYKLNADGTTRTDKTYNSIRGKVYSLVNAQTAKLGLSSVADISVGSVVKFNNEKAATTFTVSAIDTTAYPYIVTFGTADVQAVAQVGDQIFIETDLIEYDVDYEGENIVTSDATVSTTLPASDYLHLLSCRAFWKGQKANGQTAYLNYGAKRLTFDALNVIQNNAYLRPAHLRPYYMVQDNVMNAGIDKITSLGSYKAYQNKPTITTHVGIVPSLVTLDKIQIDYLKIPEIITLSDIDIFTAGEDTSQVLEFPDYLKNEIVKRVTLYQLENTNNPRIQSHPMINQEIPSIPLEILGGNRQAQAPQAVQPPQ